MFIIIFLTIQVVIQHYDTDVNKEYVIRGNSGILRCQTPSFVGDHVEVISWITDSNETFYANDPNLGRKLNSSYQNFPFHPHRHPFEFSFISNFIY